jgi:WD40 repeat protein
MRRVARLDEFAGPSRAMVQRLIEKRLLIADQRAGADVVEVAHESLLRQWPPLAGWLHEAVDDLRVLEAVERAAGEWVRNDRREAWLDHRGDRLDAAEKVAAHEDFRRRLGQDALDYVETCRARENARRRTSHIIRWSAAAAVVVVAVLAVMFWLKRVEAERERLEAQRAKIEAEASLLIVESQYDLANGNLALALDRASRAYKLLPSTASRSALFQAALEISPHAAAVVQLGTQGDRALAWSGNDSLAVAEGSGRLRPIDIAKGVRVQDGFDLPDIKRQQDGNRSTVRALAPLGADRTITVFDQGTLAVYRRGSAAPQLVEPTQQMSIYPTAQAVAVGPSGGVIVAATVDAGVVVYRCNWSMPPQSKNPCEMGALGQARGGAVAISADETRIAVGDAAGSVSVYDLSGNAIGAPAKFSAPITAIGWAAQRDWLAVGTTKGEIAVINTGDEDKTVVAQQTFGDRPVTALAWSPKELALVFVCNGTAACVWRASADADARDPFKPAVRLENHRNAITRLSFAPDGARIASSATDGTVRIWSLQQDSNVSFALYADELVELNKVETSPDRRSVAAAGSSGTIQVWNSATGLPIRRLQASGDFEVRDIAWSRNGAVAALYDNDTVNVFPDDSRQPINLPVGRRAGYHLTWTGDDSMIAVPAGGDAVVLLVPKSTGGEPVRLAAGDGSQPWGVTAIPKSRQLVASYVGGTIRVWDLDSRQPVGEPLRPPATIGGDKIGVGSLSVSPDGHWLATSSGDGSVPIYDIAKRAPWQVLRTGAPEVATVAFSPDGRKLAALGADNRLYVWTLGDSGAELYLSVGTIPHRGIVGDAAQSGNARWLDWISGDHIAIATGSAAISVVDIDPANWLKRIDDLALVGKRQ